MRNILPSLPLRPAWGGVETSSSQDLFEREGDTGRDRVAVSCSVLLSSTCWVSWTRWLTTRGLSQGQDSWKVSAGCLAVQTAPQHLTLRAYIRLFKLEGLKNYRCLRMGLFYCQRAVSIYLESHNLYYMALTLTSRIIHSFFIEFLIFYCSKHSLICWSKSPKQWINISMSHSK